MLKCCSIVLCVCVFYCLWNASVMSPNESVRCSPSNKWINTLLCGCDAFFSKESYLIYMSWTWEKRTVICDAISDTIHEKLCRDIRLVLILFVPFLSFLWDFFFVKYICFYFSIQTRNWFNVSNKFQSSIKAKLVWIDSVFLL